MKLGILTDLYNHYKFYIESCKELKVEYVVINFLGSKWLENINSNLDCDGFLVRPTHDFQEQNAIYMERLYFLNKVLNKKIYPSYEELFLYENKRNMATWLELNNFPHVKTYVFLKKDEALNFLKKTKYPIVIKSNIGSEASGVRIINNRRHANRIIKNIFGRIHPLFTFGQTMKKRKYGFTLPVWGNAIRHNAIIQEYHKIKWEWRIIKIGNSYFGHQKLLKGRFASGSDSVGWVEPPVELLDLTRRICNVGNFYSMAVDIFETVDDQFYVNELQSLFGSYLDSQMYINGDAGRFKLIDGKYNFEKGEFNRFGSYLLRVEHFIELLKSANV